MKINFSEKKINHGKSRQHACERVRLRDAKEFKKFIEKCGIKVVARV